MRRRERGTAECRGQNTAETASAADSDSDFCTCYFSAPLDRNRSRPVIAVAVASIRRLPSVGERWNPPMSMFARKVFSKCRVFASRYCNPREELRSRRSPRALYFVARSRSGRQPRELAGAARGSARTAPSPDRARSSAGWPSTDRRGTRRPTAASAGRSPRSEGRTASRSSRRRGGRRVGDFVCRYSSAHAGRERRGEHRVRLRLNCAR